MSFHALYREVIWDQLETRRRKHRLLLLYKMFNDFSPECLSSLIPPTVNTLSQYYLRNAPNIQTVDSRTAQYFNSFLPSSIREWYNLPLDIRNSDSVIIFKRKLNSDIMTIPWHFYAGNRRPQVLHTRLSTTFSSLNDDRFQKRITDSPLCLCGIVENTDHYVMRCPLYCEQRAELNHKTSQYSSVTLQILLFGNPLLSLPTNTLIFEAVHKYISDTKRF